MQRCAVTLDILCMNKYKIKTKIIEIVTNVRHDLQNPPLDVQHVEDRQLDNGDSAKWMQEEI